VATNTARIAKGQTYRSSHRQAERAKGVVCASSPRAKAGPRRQPTKTLVSKAPTGSMILEQT
jgi:hypothetical protein